MVPEQAALTPDLAAIRSDLAYMTARWRELPQAAQIEVRAFREGGTPQIGKFSPDDLDEAADWIESLNGLGFNIYAVRNPVRADCTGAATDDDILAAFFLWADCDDRAPADNILKWEGPRYTAHVKTGSAPSLRVHVYWALEQPCTDLREWRDTQTAIASHFGSDRSVINPSRIMRVAGTVSYPDAKKRARGYTKELVTIRTDYGDVRAPVTIPQMRRAFGLSSPAAGATAGVQIDTGNRQALDRDKAVSAALSGQEWHNHVIRLVASYVARGMDDAEIHRLTADLTLPGYTADDTRRDVQTAIDGARRKGWAPQQDFRPNFDHAPAPTASDPAPPAATWRLQTAAEFTADFVAPEYIVDGVIRRGMFYTLTAPTGSGKTAVMIYAATAITNGTAFAEREVETGDVIFMAGENPDDVRARVIATLEFYQVDPAKCRLHFIAGTFSVRADMERIKEEAAKLPNLVLVVIDTFAAYFDGDDENSNAQALDFARVVRKITAFPSKPAVIMPAHPVKNAGKNNLTPKGGSSLLNEVDGNLTLWNDGGILSMHWQGKFRGAEFEPLGFELERYECDRLRDHKGRLMPTILAKPIMQMRAIQIAQDNLSAENKALLSVQDHPALSVADRCIQIGLKLSTGAPHKSKLTRILEGLKDQKLVKRFRTNWELTAEGERACEMIRNGAKFAAETGV